MKYNELERKYKKRISDKLIPTAKFILILYDYDFSMKRI